MHMIVYANMFSIQMLLHFSQIVQHFSAFHYSCIHVHINSRNYIDNIRSYVPHVLDLLIIMLFRGGGGEIFREKRWH